MLLPHGSAIGAITLPLDEILPGYGIHALPTVPMTEELAIFNHL